MVVDNLENLDKKFPKYHDPIGVEKPQWVKEMERQEARKKEQKNLHEDLR